MSDIFIQIEVDEKQISDGIYYEIASYLNSNLPSIIPEIKNGCAATITRAIKNSKEYNAILTQDLLYGEIGVPDIQDVLDRIIKEIIDEMEVVPIPANIGGIPTLIGIEVGILDVSFQRLLDLEGVYFFSQGRDPGKVDWLKWLLFSGTNTVIEDYTYIPDRPRFSRTGTGIMVKSKIGFGFDTEYSGTAENNWLTRAIYNIEKDIQDVLVAEFLAVFTTV